MTQVSHEELMFRMRKIANDSSRVLDSLVAEEEKRNDSDDIRIGIVDNTLDTQAKE